MDDLSERIKAQKAKIKEANRELSKLQDEARKKSEPCIFDVEVYGMPTVEAVTKSGQTINYLQYTVVIRTNREALPPDSVKSAIESLSDKPFEPKSYVDWDEIPKEYNWVAVDKIHCQIVNRICAYHSRPILESTYWSNGSDMNWIEIKKGWIITPLPAWDKSLIHRPGAKE